MKDGQDLGPIEVDLAPTKAGEVPRIELVGIGAHLAKHPQGMLIGHVSPRGGAANAGLVVGDLILAIDGRPVDGTGFMAGIQRIRGAEGTVVTLRVRRTADSDEVDVFVTRARIREP